MGWEAREAHLAVVVLKGCVEHVGLRAPAALDDQYHVCAGVPEGRHPCRHRVVSRLGITVRDHGREAVRDLLLDGARTQRNTPRLVPLPTREHHHAWRVREASRWR